MPNYIIAYLGGKQPENPEEGREGRQKFMDWISDLGDAVVNPGTPLGMSKIISAGKVTDNHSENRLTGFSIVKADTMDAALDIAKRCPFLDIGAIEVAEVKEM
jgi:hypothetical protein